MSIVLKNVTKWFGRVKAVDNLSFVLQPGQVTGLLGPNGAGKTTTVRLITGFLTPSSGRVEVNGAVASRESIDFRHHIGYLPEDNPLYQDMTVVDYLEFTAGLFGIPRRDRRDRVREVINLFGLNGLGHLRIGKLSRGYRQRVGLAQTLVHNPEILILDEPTIGLDPNQVMAFRRFISELGKEKTVVFSTHNLAEVQALCDRVIILSRGKALSDTSIALLHQDFQDGMQYFVSIESNEGADSKDVMLGLQSMDCVKNVIQVDQDRAADNIHSFHVEASRESNVIKDLFGLCVSRGWALVDIQRRRVKMEDIFHELTRGKGS